MDKEAWVTVVPTLCIGLYVLMSCWSPNQERDTLVCLLGFRFLSVKRHHGKQDLHGLLGAGLALK